MIIGVPKEIKMDEMRVSVVPSGVEALVSAGHRVLIERNAGSGAGFLDQAYEHAGAELMVDGQAVWGQADLIVYKTDDGKRFCWVSSKISLLPYSDGEGGFS
ncbi:MAG: Alanine dehydrogenase [Dehalococcoidia bacterium]|nr:Alanine dehydrogenase [Bacillota bacterium]